MGTQVVWVFFLRHVGVHAPCICLWKVIGACCYLCYLFFSSFSCVCVRLCLVRAEVGSRREDRRRLIFYPSPARLSQGRLCHQLSTCQHCVLLFQSTGQLTFLLSLLHLPPSRNTPGKRKGKKKRDKKMNREGDAPCSRCSFAHISLSPKEAQIHDDRKKCHLFLFYLALHVICLIKHWCSFNKTQPLFSGSNSRQTLQVEKVFLYTGQFWWILTDQNIHLCILTYLIRKLHLHI